MCGAALVIAALTSAARADTTDRDAVEQALTGSLADFKHCGRRPKAVFDWNAYDAIDWKKAGKDRREYLASERTTVKSLGAGLDELCADSDYEAVLATVTTIVYKPTDDRSVTLVAAIAGTTLTFTDYTFGSTRVIDDFADAAREACESASVPRSGGSAPAPSPTRKPAARPAPASSAWDGRYTPGHLSTMGGLCARPDFTGPLTVSGGRFSFPWYVDDWAPSTARQARAVKVGRADGVVHANGTATTTVTFSGPALRARQVRTVKVKRQLEAIKSVPIKFSRRDGARRATLVAHLFGGDCKVEWEIAAPKAAKPGPPTSRPARSRSREQQQQQQPDDSARRAREYSERQARRTGCYSSCQTKFEQCRQNRCTAPKDACHEQCRDMTDSSQREECSSRCEDVVARCRSGCDEERDTCNSDCANL